MRPKAPAVLDVVHLLLEADRPRRFLLTGSSARKLRRGAAKLSGRAENAGRVSSKICCCRSASPYFPGGPGAISLLVTSFAVSMPGYTFRYGRLTRWIAYRGAGAALALL